MKCMVSLTVPLTVMTSLLSLLSQAVPAKAAQLADGSVQFDQPLAVLDAGATASRTSEGGLYYFTINVPANAGEPLAAVVVTPVVGSQPLNRPDVPFNLNATEAFQGTPEQAGGALDLQSVQQLSSSRTSQAVQVSFAQPIPPGTTLTIGLKPTQRPNRRHDYQFELTAIPAAADPVPVSLGRQTLSFRSNRYRDYPFWWSRDDIFPGYSEGDQRVLFWDLPPEFNPYLRQRRQQSF